MNSIPRTERKRRPLRAFWRFTLFPLALAAHLFILFEEWIWARARRAMAALARAPMIQSFERRLGSASPALSALAFLLPAVVLFPFKLAGLYLIAHEHPLAGAAVFILAKMVGAALLARVWMVCEPALRRVSWLCVVIDWVLAKKDALKAWVRSIWVVRRAKAFLVSTRARARSVERRLGVKLWGRAVRRARDGVDKI